MKIAIVSTEPLKFFKNTNRGGGEILFENLIKQILLVDDYKLYIFCPANCNLEEIDTVKYSNIVFVKINADSHSDKYLQEIKQIVDVEKYDIVINHNMYNPYAITLLQCHSYLHRANNIFPLFRPIKRFLSRKKIKWQKTIYQNANKNKYIAVSQKVRQDFSKNYNIPLQNIIVSYPGCIIPSGINISEPQKEENITFGIVANSSLNKGGHLFLFVCGLLHLLGAKFNIKIIAPKYNKDIFMKSIIKLFNMGKYTEVLPFQNDMSLFYKSIDVIVLPSLNEAFGLVVLEAMSLAKPAIVSSTSGASEIIDSKNGVIFNRHSILDFINKIKYFINIYNNNFDKYRQFSDNALLTAKKYNWKKFTDTILNQY